MSPFNLGLRFLLELGMLGALGFWGYRLGHPTLRWFCAIGLPVLAAVCWGVFAVPGDPSRSGDTMIATPGWLRLILELALFAAATAALWTAGAWWPSGVLATLVALHYVFSYERIAWLLEQG